MAKKKSLLEKMELNPADDWTISDVAKLCRQEGLNLEKPKSGSHYLVFSELLHGMPSVPYKRPIKAFYIKRLTSFARSHQEIAAKRRSEAK